MRKSIKRMLSAVLAVIIATAALSAMTIDVYADPSLPRANTEKRHVLCTALSSSAKTYYIGQYTYDRLSELSGASDVSTSIKAMQNNSLYKELQSLMTSTHDFKTSYSGTGSGSLAYYWQRTDAVGGKAGSFVLIYSDTTVSMKGSGWNREHVWPKSNASFHQSNGGSDLHHLRPENPNVNSTRGNLPFGNVNGVYSNATPGTCYWKTNALFEPRDNVKGDVARILLYVYVRWGENNIYTDTGNGKKIIESLDTLLDWCRLDPVDTWEMKRNDLVQQVQGNRNVFIDYPELAWKMFGREIPAGMATPSSAGCTHRWTISSTVSATCVSEGKKVYTCSLCGSTKSEKLPMTEHSLSEPLLTEKNEGRILSQSCLVCHKLYEKRYPFELGDCDRDGQLTTRDVTHLLNILEDNLQWSQDEDVNGDGTLTIYDVTKLLEFLSILQ